MVSAHEHFRRRRLQVVWLNIAAFAISEAAAGSDISAMTTTARRSGSGYVIDGEKTWISNGGIADGFRRPLLTRGAWDADNKA